MEELAGACEAAKAEFRPLSQTDLAELRAELVDAVGRLDRRLDAAGENGDAWRRYLDWEALQAEIAIGHTPDPAVLDAIRKKYAAGHEGLELVWFVDVREGLRRYRDMTRRLDNATLQESYEQLLDFLAEHVEAYAAEATADEALVLGEVIRELEEARQAPALVRAIRHHFQRPNLFVRASSDVVSAGFAEPVDDVRPVREVILGTDIYGTGHTTGQVSVELPSDPNRAVIDTIFLGSMQSKNVGYNGPVTIYSNGFTRLAARKRLWLDAEGLASMPTVSRAATDTQITGIRAKRDSVCIERIAWKQACRKKAEAECIASRLAERRLNQQMDQQAGERLSEANRRLVEKLRRPLEERKLYPQQLGFSTMPDALQFVSLQASRSQLGAPGAPPEPAGAYDLEVFVHESTINNMAATVLAGMTLSSDGLENTVVSLLGELPEQLKADEGQEDWAITFPQQRPVSITFGEDGFRVTIRGQRFYEEGESYPGMEITAEYKISRADGAFQLVRQGDLEIVPLGFQPGSRQFSSREVVIRTLLQRRFGKMFEEEIRGEGIELPGEWSVLGVMTPVVFTCEDGWLTVAWEQTPGAEQLAQTED